MVQLIQASCKLPEKLLLYNVSTVRGNDNREVLLASGGYACIYKGCWTDNTTFPNHLVIKLWHSWKSDVPWRSEEDRTEV